MNSLLITKNFEKKNIEKTFVAGKKKPVERVVSVDAYAKGVTYHDVSEEVAIAAVLAKATQDEWAIELAKKSNPKLAAEAEKDKSLAEEATEKLGVANETIADLKGQLKTALAARDASQNESAEAVKAFNVFTGEDTADVADVAAMTAVLTEQTPKPKAA